MDKWQATIQFASVADGINGVKQLIFFRQLGVGCQVVLEAKAHESRVVVKFNPTYYVHSTNVIEVLDVQIVPILGGRPTLMVLDLLKHTKQIILCTLYVLTTLQFQLSWQAVHDWCNNLMFQLINHLKVSYIYHKY